MIKCWRLTQLASSGVLQRNADLLPFDLRTWPWRAGCQVIAPEPKLVRCHVTPLAAATRPEATEGTAFMCVYVPQSYSASVITFRISVCCLGPCWLSEECDSSRELMILALEGCY